MKNFSITASCFYFPFYMVGKIFGLFPSEFGLILGLLALAAFCYMLVYLWTSTSTKDDKLFWSIAIFFLPPLALPIFYFCKVRKDLTAPKESPEPSGT